MPKPIQVIEALLQKTFCSKVPLELVLLPAEPRPTAVTIGWSSQAVAPIDAHIEVGNESSQHLDFTIP